MNGEAGRAGKTSPFYVEKWKNAWKTNAKFLNFGWILFCWRVATPVIIPLVSSIELKILIFISLTFCKTISYCFVQDHIILL